MLEESAKAPVKAGDQLGTLRYRFNGEEIGNIPVIAAGMWIRADFLTM